MGCTFGFFGVWGKVAKPAVPAAEHPVSRITRAQTRASTESSQPLRASFPRPRASDSPMWESLATEGRPAESPALTLGQKLQEEQIEWPPNQNKYFIPVNILKKLVTEESVKTELRTIYPSLSDKKILSYTTSICQDAKKLFAILLCGVKTNYIANFLDEGITDQDLPFVRSYLPECNNFQTQHHPFNLCKKDHDKCLKHTHKHCAIRAMISWSQRDIRQMCGDQWLVQSPVFKRIPGKIPHFELDPTVILPFVDDQEGQQTSQGGYSDVWGVRIHPAHQDVYRSTLPHVITPLLAIKRPFSAKYEDFKKETDMLGALAVRDHPHLIKLLATYKFKGHYHLLFPYANTNLRGYWNGTDLPHHNAATYRWFLRQVCGLASGLNAIHNFKAKIPLGSEEASPALMVPVKGHLTVKPEEEKFGRHGDIKPENILWSNELGLGGDAGILQIADMGLGRFHRLESRSRVDPRTISGSQTYMPPEVILGKDVSRAYDMWSLGCVFLEFITWLLDGGTRISDFSTARAETGLDGINDDTFFTLNVADDGTKNACLRKGVKTWIRDLHQHPRCSTMIKELLQLVQRGMLVVDSRRRIRSEDLDTELRNISIRAENSLEFLIGANAPILDPGSGVKLPRGPMAAYAPIQAFSIPRRNSDVSLSSRGEMSPIMPVVQVQDFSSLPKDENVPPRETVLVQSPA